MAYSSQIEAPRRVFVDSMQMSMMGGPEAIARQSFTPSEKLARDVSNGQLTMEYVVQHKKELPILFNITKQFLLDTLYTQVNVLRTAALFHGESVERHGGQPLLTFDHIAQMEDPTTGKESNPHKKLKTLTANLVDGVSTDGIS